MSIFAPSNEDEKRDTLPCGCRRDGSYICRTHVAKELAHEAATLVSLSLFIGALLAWAAILAR